MFARRTIRELQKGKRQSVTAIKLLIGSLIILKWSRVPDRDISNIREDMQSDVCRLYSGNFPDANERRFTKYTRFFKNTTYVYRDKSRVKGYCLYHIVPSISSGGLRKTAILHSIVVDARSRGQGIGTRLLQMSISEMRLNSVDRITLYVAKENKAAIDLYRRFGFEIESELRDICSPGKECYHMQFRLEQHINANGCQ